MAENDDRDVNVTEPAAPGGEGAGGDGASDGGQSASEGLHIHGQGHEALEDGVEQQGTPDNLRPSEDVFGNANVQSGRRTTNEGLLNGLPAQGETVADQSPVIADDYVPSEPDNAVESEFDAQPEDRQRTVAADGDDEADEEVAAEEEPAELRRTELPPGEPQGAPAADPAPPA
ncbi:MAG: hypothetical protein LDL26_10220, partial [Caenispirillum bisanense]|nr:hypothetical protein [Caenispirillum bisanense]MCA1974188.1 hypothetical protein [Caenispirillum sp.]